MKALSHVHAVTHAVGNILRRVVIMVASMVAFGTLMSRMSALGSAIAIGGSYMYAMAKHGEKEEEQNAAREMAPTRRLIRRCRCSCPPRGSSKGRKRLREIFEERRHTAVSRCCKFVSDQCRAVREWESVARGASQSHSRLCACVCVCAFGSAQDWCG